jgi:hypothetical protein
MLALLLPPIVLGFKIFLEKAVYFETKVCRGLHKNGSLRAVEYI